MNWVSINLKRNQSWKGKYTLLIQKEKILIEKNVHPQVMCEGDIKKLI
jgi:hypothetical protein